MAFEVGFLERFQELHVKVHRQRRELVQRFRGAVVEGDEHDVRVRLGLSAAGHAQVVKIGFEEVEVEIDEEGGKPGGSRENNQRFFKAAGDHPRFSDPA